MPKIEVFDCLKLNQYVKSSEFNKFYPLKVNNEDGCSRYILTNNGNIMLLKSNITLFNSNYNDSNNYIMDPGSLNINLDKNYKNDSKFIDSINIFCDKIKLKIYEKYNILIDNDILSKDKSTYEYCFESKMIVGETMLKSTRVIFNNHDGFKLVIPPDIHSINNITQSKWINCIFYFLPIIYSKNDKYWFVNKTLNFNIFENPTIKSCSNENILSNYENELVSNNITNRTVTNKSLENNLTVNTNFKSFDRKDRTEYDCSLIEPISPCDFTENDVFTFEEQEFLRDLF